MRAVGKSVRGMKRENNEDAIFVSRPGDYPEDLYIVADGMGGHNGGEVASAEAVRAFIKYIVKNHPAAVKSGELLELMTEAAQFSNRAVFEKSRTSPELYGMGTTITASLISGGRAYIIHAGDSRLYVFRSGKLKQITKDHSYVMEMVKMGEITKEEAKVHPKRNIITRALGTDMELDIDATVLPLEESDVLLMCTDGLDNMVTDDRIEEILNKETKMEDKLAELIDTANEKGGFDNISIILIG